MSAPTAPCFGQSDLFDSIDLQDHLAAKELCDTCPLIGACAANLADAVAASTSGGRPEGTWAGTLLGPERLAERREKARVAREDQEWSDADARAAAARYRQGDRDDRTRAGNRAYEARRRAALRARRRAA